jgi:pimeloyl-ACP methyl ester carboxylesterase
MRLSRSHRDSTIMLPDGRKLGYAAYGDPSGKPLVFFPGTPSSRLIRPPEEPAKKYGVRIISVERPGFGLSDFQPGRRILDWPEDVLAFSESLGLDCFAVAGISGGGPYAAACAYKIPHKLTGVVIISGVGPVDVLGGIKEMPSIRQLGALIARSFPWMLRPILWLVSNPRRNPEKFFQRMVSGNSTIDQEILSRPSIKGMLMKSYLEATRNGLRGFAHEAILLSNSWGFTLDEISFPIHLWHGEQDANVSLSAARYMADTIPDCHATFLVDEGHWLIIKHWEEILAGLLGSGVPSNVGHIKRLENRQTKRDR